MSEQGLEYEAGDRHRQALFRGLGFNDSKTVNRAAMRKEELSQDEDEEMLGAEAARQFTSLAATPNYLSLDRSDVQYAACTNMENPRRRSYRVM